MTRTAILDLTSYSSQFDDLATAGETIRVWLARAMPADSLTVVPVAAGAALPEIAGFDSFLISGSEKGVYDEAPWMKAARDFLLAARQAGKPLFGICFGHQLMADTFGGKAELSDAGERVGVERYAFGGGEFDAHVWHRDQVTRLPPGARVAGQAGYCPYGILEYEFGAASIQFHPEMERAYIDEMVSRYSGNHFSGERAAGIRASIASGDVAPDLFAMQASSVLTGGRLDP